ncbi:MAG: Tim44/TimA family putative adaptor protein [Pseudomonadota bacterium]
MNSSFIQLLVLAGIAVFLILRLRSVLGTRDGFEQEKPRGRTPGAETETRREFEVIEGGPDRDIVDHVDDGTGAAIALAAMKEVEPDFGVTDFLQGARGAYEMILMAYENGEIEEIRDFVDAEIYEAFTGGIEARQEQGITIDATFIGVRETTLQEATFDAATKTAEITVRFVGELSSTVRDKGGDVIEAESSPMKRQRDIWTFSRAMGSNDPNWVLVATDE